MSILTNANILLTGGTGTFGHAFVAHALAIGAARIVVFSRDELKQSQMRAHFNHDERLRFFVGDVRDPDRLLRAMRNVDFVIHAAAMKRVEACELHIAEANATNNLGSENVVNAAIASNVKRAILLSSDKAASPLGVYGCTKLFAERWFVNGNVYAAGTRTRLLATRYGNVLGSRGSVLDIWRAQAATGQPLTITSRECSRFWMTIHDAVWLVETALRDGRGGEVFIPKIGAAPLTLLGRALCGDDVQFVETKLGRIEKVHEVLVTEEEARHCHSCDDYYIIEPERTWEHLPPLDRPLVAPGWSYRSDRNSWQMSLDELRSMIRSPAHEE